MTLDDALDFLDVHFLATGVDARRLATEEQDAPVLTIARPVPRDAVPHPIDHREDLLRTLGLAEVPERQMSGAGDPTDLAAARSRSQDGAAVVTQDHAAGAEIVGRQADVRRTGVVAH